MTTRNRDPLAGNLPLMSTLDKGLVPRSPGGSTNFLRADGTWATPGGGGGGAIYVFKSADETVTNSTTFQDDDHLTFSLAANEKASFDLLLVATSPSATPDIKFAFSVPAGATGAWGAWTPTTNNTGSGFAGFGDSNFIPATIAAAGTTVMCARGMIVNGANSGSLTLRWAQNTLDAANGTTVKTGSWLLYGKV